MLVDARLVLAPGALVLANGSALGQTPPPESVLITARPPAPVDKRVMRILSVGGLMAAIHA